MVSLPDIPSESALARLFYEERGHGEATWFALPGGATLFKAGEPADRDRLAIRANAPLEPRKPQRPADHGLFDTNARNQIEMF